MQTYPPTDSLYKFSAIVGIIILVLSVYAPFKILYNIKQETIELERRVSVAEIESEFLHRQIEESHEIIELSRTMMKKGYKPDLTKIDMP